MAFAISWDDWRIVEAVASEGTTSGAAARLGLNQSTVFRRVSQLEGDLGVRLFDRDKRGFRLTTEGEAVLPDIRRLAEIAFDIERRVSGLDERSAGKVRLSVNTTVVRYLLSAHLAEFQAEYPDIAVQLDVTDRLANVKEREADLVIRGDNDPDPDLFGRRLMRLSYAIYTSRAREDVELQARAFSANPALLDWVLFDGDLLRTDPGQWLQKHLSGISPVVTANDVEITAYLARDGLGCALLPRFLGDRVPGLVQISDPIPGLFTELWVLTHVDLRNTARVSALLRFIADKVRQKSELPHA